MTEAGYSKPTEIQYSAIPHIFLAGRDIIVSAQAGAGKTAAFCDAYFTAAERQTPDHKEIRTLILYTHSGTGNTDRREF